MTEQPNNQQGAYNGQPYNSPAPNLNPYEKYQLLKSNNFQAPPGTQKIWTQQSNLNRNLTFWKPDAQARFRPDLPPAVWDNSKQYQGYWGDPKRVVDAYNFLRVQDDDYVPPSYLDPEFVNDMYKQLKTFNSGNDDPYRWEPLPFGHEASYYAYVQPGADFWENTPGNRFELSVPRQRLDLAASISAMSKIVDEVNATLAESYEAGQISLDEYDQSVKWFSQYALSPEARAAVADGTLSAETLAGAFDPRDYTQLAVSDLLEKQGILDLNGQPATDYKDMETWQQALLTVFGAPEGMNLPKVQKQVAPVLGAGMSAMGVFGAITTSALIAAKISAPIAGAITVATGGGGVALAPIVMAAAAVVGGFAGWKQYQASISGQENDVSKVTTFLFNVLAEGTERSIGTATIMSEVNQFVNEAEAKGMTEPEVNQAVLERYGVSPEGFWDLFSQAWSASRLQYESAGGQGAGDWFADTVSTAVHAIKPEWSTGTTTTPGQVWQLQNGMTSPTNLGLNSTETRAAIMRDFASLGDNPSKEDRDALAAMWSDALGFSGNMNEFTGQIFLDPLNFVPAAVNKSVDIYATKKFNLATAADDLVASKKYANLSAAAKQGIGNPIIDAFPFGLQQGVEWAGKLVTKITKGADASVPRWLRGSMNPAQVFNYASALDNQGISQQTFMSAYDDLRQRGYNAPTGFAIDITAAVEAGNLSPYGRMFMSGDGLSATVQLFDPNGRAYSTETFYAADKTPFRSPSEAMDRLKVIVNEPGYSGTEKSKINKFLDSPLEMTQKSRLGMVDYMKDLKADSSPITAAVTNPSIINPETGEVMAQGKLVLDSIDETHKTYRVESPDGLTQYTVDMESDKVITMTVNGRVELIPADGYLVTPGRNVDMADPNLTRINMQAANDMATAFGLEKPYVESIYSEGAKPDSAAVATQLTGNKFVDYFIKLADYTPEAKITITNRAITETILGATLLGKNDPDKFFAFFDYLSGRPVEVSQQMKDFALGGTVATAMLTLKDALKEGSAFYTLRKNWDISTIRRVEIQNLARAIGVDINKIPTIRLDEITAKLDAYNRKAANDGTSPQIEMTAAEIKKFISPFQGSDALPLTKEALVSSAIFAVIADSERAAIKMYDPQTKSTLGQLSALAKSIIGLPLISANPATWVMNMFNNWVTMNVMVGTGGTLITGDALAKSQARFGVDYTSLIGNEFKVADVISKATAEYNKIMNPDNWITDARHFIAGLSSSEVTPLDNLARAAGVKPDDLLIMSTGDIQKAITSRAGARKFKKQTRGFETISLKQIESKLAPFIGDDAKPLTHSKFNPLSTYGKIEQFFAIRTMHMAIEQAMAAPLSDIRPELRNELIAAGMTDKQLKAFQAAANKAYNLQEIESFYKNGEIVYNPVPDEIIGVALDRMAEGDPGKRAAIETLLDFNGLRDDLTEALSKPRTPDEINAIKHDLYQRLRTAANQTRVNNLAGEFSKVTEDTAGHIGLLKNLYSISTQEYQTLFDANREFGTYWGLIDDATKNDMGTREFNAYKANLWAFYSDRVKAMWEDTRTVMLNGITAGMVKAGVGEDGDFFVANLRQRLTLMEGVFKEISQINQDAYDGVLPKGTDANKLIRDVYKKYGTARDGNQKAWVDHIIEMFDRDGTPPTGKTKEATHNSLVGFMGEFLKRDRKFRNDVLGHRDSIKNMNYEARRAANRAFYEQTYQPQALDILKFLTNDAYEEFNTIRPSKHSSKGQGQTKATKTQPSTLIETDLASRRAELARNSTVLEHQAMVDAQTRAAYGTYNKMTFQNEINAATNLTSDAQRASVSAYFDAFDDSVKRLTGGKFGFYDSLGAIEAFDTDRLPQDKFPSPDGQGYIAAMTYGDDGKFVLNFATKAADMSSVFHEGSHAIVDTARRMYDMGVFPGYETILADAGHTTVEAFNAMDNAAKSKVYDDIADSMFKWQSDIEVAKAMPTKLQAAFRVMSDFFTDLINRLMARYKDVELTPAVKEVYRSLFTQSELAAKADRNAVRISKFREGKTFTVYGADNSRIYNLIPVVVEADTLRPSHDLGGHQNPDFPQKYQPREYKLSFVRERAAKLTPDLLLKQPVDLANGAPIIDEFGNVVAGNHRIGFLNEARDSFPEQWAKYQQALPENLAQYGLTDADLKDMTNPVLVYKVADDADTMNIVTDANTPNQQQMSALELANLYAPHLDNNLISKIEFREGKTVDDVIRSESVDDLRRNFIDNLQDVEKGQYLIGDTVFMNDRGYQAFKEALLARVYGGTVDGQILLKEMISGGSDFSKTFTNAMIEAMPAMARLESAIAAGDLDASYSISGKLATAIIEYQIWRNQSKVNRYSLQEMAGQLWGTIPQDIVKMEIFFNNNSTNAKKLADFFIMYANEVTRKTDNIALPGFEDTVALKPAAELLDGLLDAVNAAGQTAVIADMSNSNLSQMVNNGYDGWEGRLQTFIEPVLQKFLTDMKDPTIPPDWSNVEGLYSGSRKSYAAIRKTIKQIFSNDPKVNNDMRTLILTQAHNKLLAESVAYRTYNGIEGTPAADAFMVQNAISKLSAAASAEGTQVEKFNAIKDPLQNAFDLLDDLKSRSGDPQSIADLEKAISGSRVEQLGDTDIIESVPLFETQAPAAEGKLPSDVINDLYELDYGTLDILYMTPEMAADIINNKTLNDDPFRVSFIDRLHRLGYSDKDIADMKAAGDTDYAYIIENGIRKGSPDVKTLIKPSDVQDALYHLGYDKIEIESMTYEEAVDIAKNKIENPTPLDISLQNKLHLLGYTDQDRNDMRLTGARATYIVENQIRKGDPGSEPTPPPPAPGQGDLFGQPAYLDDVNVSGIKDDAGQIITFYHGTKSGVFEEFKSNISKKNQLGFGIHFTQNEEMAGSYSTGARAAIYQVNLVSKKPLLADVIVKATDPEWELVKQLVPSDARLSRISMNDENGVRQTYLQRAIDMTDPARAEKIIRAAGYDAVRYSAEYIRGAVSGGRPATSLGDTDQSWVVFSDNQIRILGKKKPGAVEYEPFRYSNGLFGQPDELSYQPGDPLPSVTSDPPQGALAVDQASALTQLNNNDIMGLVDEVTSELETYMRNNTTFDMKDTIPQAAFDALKKQTTVWDGELGSKKLGAMDFAKLSRDHSLLNYTQRRGIDGLMGHVFPYHYWYTTSVTEWAKHLIGAPMIGSAWSKYEELRRRNGMLGFPSRMEGKFWIPAPWLPDYLGDEIFSSPQSRLMPLESIMQPVSLYSDLSETMTKNTIYKINDMVRKGIISPAQAAASIQSGGDQIWQDALAEAILEDDGALSDSVTLASQLMGVAPWWQYSYYFATGQKDKISVLPPTKIGQALSSFRSSDEPGAPSNLGTLIGDILATAGNVIKYPGETMRDLAGMSPYGEPGDYYVRLMLASMLGDGYTSDVAEVERQMIERQGNYWEEAKRRADVYLSVRLPGSMFLHQIQEFAQNPSAENASGIPQAFFLTMFPAGMIPQGEQALRDIAPIYQEAWKKYNMGDKEALNRFEEQYPEYRIRRNMFKDNETLLKGFLVDQIWDKYTSIPKASRQLAVQSLGDNFQSLFLEGKAYDRIDDETLAAWSYSLGGMVPQTEQTAGAVESNQVPVPRYTPEVEAAVTEFQAQRDEMFPDYYWQQQIYWDTAEGEREGLKRQMPSYFRYLTWRNNYYDQNPIVKQWADDQSARRDGGDDRLLSPVGDTLGGSNASIPSNSVLIEFDNTLKAELGKYIINGTPLSSGAKAELTRLWTAKGKPGGSLEQWINAVLGLRR